jgi:DNA-binding CsgD family transcriptional regulator
MEGDGTGGSRSTVDRSATELVARLLVAVDHPLPVEVLSRIDALAGVDLASVLSHLERTGLVEWHRDDTLTATVIAHSDIHLVRAERAQLRGWTGWAAASAATSSVLSPVVLMAWIVDGGRVHPDPAIVRWALERSDQLLRSGDIATAIDLLTVLDAAVARGLRVSSVDEIRIATRVSFLLRWAGRGDEADALAQRALATARSSADPAALAVATVAWRPGAIGISDDVTELALIAEAAARLPDGHDEVRSRLLAVHASALLFVDIDAARAISAEALEMAQRTDDPETVIEAAYAVRLAHWHPSEQERALDLAQLMVSTAPRALDLTEYGATTRLQVFMERGDWAHVDHEIATMGHRLQAAPRPVEVVWWTMSRVARAQSRGDWDTARDLIADLLGHHVGPEYGAAFQLLLTQQVLDAWHRGEDLLPLVGADVLPAGPMRTSWEACLLGWTCERRDHDDVRAELDRLMPDGAASIRADLTFGPVTSSLAMAAARVGAQDHAATLFELVCPFADQWAGTGGAVVNGPYALHLARLADLLGHSDNAAAFLDQAERSAAAGECRPWLARIALARAERTDDPGERRLHARAALDTATDLGMALVAEDAQRLLGKGLPHGLTAREAEVLRLVAAGTTNSGIADELFVSVKTVERHLLNAYRKIGARNRSDATAFTVREL